MTPSPDMPASGMSAQLRARAKSEDADGMSISIRDLVREVSQEAEPVDEAIRIIGAMVGVIEHEKGLHIASQILDALADATREGISTTDEAVKTMSTAKPLSDFDHEYLLACANLVNLHDQPTMAADVLCEAGISWREVLASDLTDYDMRALREIKKERSGKAFKP